MCARPLALACLLMFLAACPSLAQKPEAGRLGRHVLVISVDGMGPSFYTSPKPNLRIPNLRRFKREGSFAEGVEGVYPSVTYPSHTTLVTGRLPAEHGIYSNLSSREAGKNSADWFWFAKAIKAPTLWDEARAAGLVTAAVSWPVTVGAAIDWNVPEVWDPRFGPVGDPVYLAKNMNPLLALELGAMLGVPKAGADDDVNRTRIAAYLFAKYKPNLLLVHLTKLDDAEHHRGSESPEAAAALEQTDARIGELLEAAKQAGLEQATDVFIVSDHGFLPVKREIRPNVLLVRAGLLGADAQGNITGGKIAVVSNGGSFFIYWPEDRDLRAEVRAALQPLIERGGVWAVLDRAALAELGAEPAVQMALEAPAGAHFAADAAGDVIRPRPAPGGAHGFLPFRRGLEASFIAWGPRIKRGVNLHRIRMAAIAPTVLKDLGIENPRFGTEPPLVDLFKPKAPARPPLKVRP